MFMVCQLIVVVVPGGSCPGQQCDSIDLQALLGHGSDLGISLGQSFFCTF